MLCASGILEYRMFAHFLYIQYLDLLIEQRCFFLYELGRGATSV
jgi:hypothetical protein